MALQGGAEARLGVDIGGTFTDVALEARRAPLQRQNPDHAARRRSAPCSRRSRAVLREAALAPGDLSIIIHGTTLATNAIIERKGARTALLTTEGSATRSRSATRTGSSNTTSISTCRRPWCRAGCALPVPSGSMRAAGARPARRGRGDERWPTGSPPTGVESVAIGYLHSFTNPAHEAAHREILAARLPGVAVTCRARCRPRCANTSASRPPAPTPTCSR